MYIKKLLFLFLIFFGSFQLVFAVPGSCLPTHYSCNPGAGGVSDQDDDSSTEWTWTCRGTGISPDAYCSELKPVAPPADCSYGVSHGNSRIMYQSSSVPFGNTCTSQNRFCTDGSLSGSYTKTSCTVLSAPVPTSELGVCSSVHGTNSYLQPSNLCSSTGGNSALTFLGNTWSWTCFGDSIADDVDCFANKKIDGACNTVTVDQCVEGNFG
ncbi:MAG: hypothetical protein HRU03_09485, partial [Nanoarchaeales archaeon]|nr:hypothetical protein [Nanoarchaeales archaeon]